MPIAKLTDQTGLLATLPKNIGSKVAALYHQGSPTSLWTEVEKAILDPEVNIESYCHCARLEGHPHFDDMLAQTIRDAYGGPVYDFLTGEGIPAPITIY